MQCRVSRQGGYLDGPCLDTFVGLSYHILNEP